MSNSAMLRCVVLCCAMLCDVIFGHVVNFIASYVMVGYAIQSNDT